jgi:CRISPR-associated protein Csm2
MSFQDAFKKAGYKSTENSSQPNRPQQNSTPSQNRGSTPSRPSAPYNQQYGNRNPVPARTPIQALTLTKEYVDLAEKHISQGEIKITTSKIRKFLTQVIEVYHDERIRQEETLSPESISRIQLIRMRMLYEAGRDPDVKNFVERTQLIEYLKGIGNSRSSFIDYTHYLEALVAYHRYYGGRE